MYSGALAAFARSCRTDEEFHESIVRGAHNGHLLSMYRMIVRRMTDFRRETLKLERSSQRFVPGHRDRDLRPPASREQQCRGSSHRRALQ
jgi:DNA-binding GntR family transcriptional regulator